MNKKIKYFFFIITLGFLVNCSFDNKTGIWSGDKEEKERIAELERLQKQKINVVKIYTSENIYLKEIAATQNIKLSKPKTNTSWEMSGLNLQNFIGNLYLPKINNNFLKKKIGKDKFSISRSMSSPLITDNTIILADDKGTIFNIDKRGKVRWKKNIYKKLYKKIYKNLSFSISENKLYISDNIGFLYAVNLSDGKIIWVKNFGIPIKSNLKVLDDKIFLINQDNRIFCVDIETGSKIWDIRAITSFIKSQQNLALAISKNNDLVVLNSSGDLIKTKASSGRIYWSLNAIGTLAHDTDFFQSSEIVIDDNEIFFSDTSNFYSYDLSNGYLNWKVNIGSKNTPIIDRNNIFSVTDNGYFVNLDRQSGKTIWSTNILKSLKKRKQDTKITGFVLGSGKIYAVSLNGFLIVCSATSGKVEYIKKIGDTITASPIINNGSLYILTEKSKIIGFN